MKKSDAANYFDLLAKALSEVKEVEIKNKETGEVDGTIPEEAIAGMTLALTYAEMVLIDDFDGTNPIRGVSTLIRTYADVVLGISSLPMEDADD